MKLKGLNAPVDEPKEKMRGKKHRFFMKKDKKKSFFGRKMKMVQDGR